MNRWKKYIKSKGFKGETDYPYMPYYDKDLDTVIFKIEKGGLSCNEYYYPIGWVKHYIKKNGQVEEIFDI